MKVVFGNCYVLIIHGGEKKNSIKIIHRYFMHDLCTTNSLNHPSYHRHLTRIKKTTSEPSSWPKVCVCGCGCVCLWMIIGDEW
jgi:hypothetical protein